MTRTRKYNSLGVWLRWARLLTAAVMLALLCAPVLGDRYEAAREAMQPPPPVRIANPHPDMGAIPEARSPQVKERLQSAAGQKPAPGEETAQLPETQPPGEIPEPSVKPAEGRLTEGPAEPPPADQDDPERVRFTAQDLYYHEGAVGARGDITLHYQDITIRTEEAQLDRDQRWGAFLGNVRLEQPLYRARSHELRYNLDTDEWTGATGRVRVDPDFFTEGVQEPLFFSWERAEGLPDLVVAEEATGTSCDYLDDGRHVHYELRSNRITVIPEKRVVFSRPTLYLFGRRVVRYPWDLKLSMDRRENRFLPEVGQNQVEGYFAKFAFGYLLSRFGDGFVRLHLTQKRGTGLGFDHAFKSAQHTAEASFFAEPSQGSLTGRLSHQARLSGALSSNLSASFQDNSGFGAGTSSTIANWTLRHIGGTSSSLLGFQHSVNETGFATSRRFTTNLTYNQRLGSSGDVQFRSVHRHAKSRADQPRDEELNTDLALRYRQPAYDVELLAQKRYDLGSSSAASRFSAFNRTPEIVIRTDSRRLGDKKLFGEDVRAEVYLGRFEQVPDLPGMYRTGVNLDVPGKRRMIDQHTALHTSWRFRQLFTSDGSAQWIGDFRTEIRRELSASWNTRLYFQYSKPQGFSPLRIDSAAPYSNMTFQAVRLVADRMRLEVTGGRDFQNNYYHDALLRSEIMLAERSRLELQTGYSLQNDQWRPLNARWIVAADRNLWASLSANYNIDQHELSNVGLDLDWSPHWQWRLRFLGGYSSFGGFDQAEISIERDLHCMVGAVSYNKSTREFRLGLGIKAFPGDTRTFGIGAGGARFESTFGDIY